MSTVAALLAEARTLGMDRLDAQLLLAHVLGQSRSWLLANDDASLNADQLHRLRSFFKRRAGGEPLAYLVGEKEFHGLTLRVSPAVLVPRPDTETLVDWAIELMTPSSAVLDMGTGSGAVALALKHAHPQAQITALDASAPALAVARENGKRLRLEVEWLLSDWWQQLEGRRFDLIVSNPPYIAGDDAHLAALQHEPMQALTPGGDGLDSLRQIIAGARTHLSPGGWLLLEHGYDQAAAVADLLRQHRFQDVTTRHDLAGHTRCTGGRQS
ncbi:MAG TPA: peptide chain release factor N(5)-glutamine methyltransferase [Rhizobacter sp.]|nr:peptide chain release factor N(5)-glutamine methyltransferase [Rhizobacter sp.]